MRTELNSRGPTQTPVRLGILMFGSRMTDSVSTTVKSETAHSYNHSGPRLTLLWSNRLRRFQNSRRFVSKIIGNLAFLLRGNTPYHVH